MARQAARAEHNGFARAHITLQQPVHGHAAGQVGGDFFPHAALRGREVERQHGHELFVQGQRTILRRLGAQHRGAQPVAFTAGLVLRELLRQQLLGFQALPGGVAVVFQGGQGHIRRGVMQKSERLAQSPRALEAILALIHGMRRLHPRRQGV